jgi:hypothetical protein
LLLPPHAANPATISPIHAHRTRCLIASLSSE